MIFYSRSLDLVAQVNKVILDERNETKPVGDLRPFNFVHKFS